MMKRILIVLAVLALIITTNGCGKTTESPTTSEPSSMSEQNDASQSSGEAEVPSSSTADGNTIPPSSNDEYSMKTVMSLIESGITDYDGHEVFYEDGVIVVNIWMNGLADAVSSVQAGLIDKSLWEELRQSIKIMAGSCRTLLDTMGKKDINVMTNLLNDKNLDNVILSLLNDTIIYDATTE